MEERRRILTGCGGAILSLAYLPSGCFIIFYLAYDIYDVKKSAEPYYKHIYLGSFSWDGKDIPPPASLRKKELDSDEE